MSPLRARVELIVAIALTALAVLTIVWPDWIEGVFGYDPDHGSGAVEAAIIVVLALAAGAAWLYRHFDRKRAAGANATRSQRSPST